MASTAVPLRPCLFDSDEGSTSKLTRSDIALGATLSPRGNELAVFSQLFSEQPQKGNAPSKLKTPSLPNQDAVWMAKCSRTERSAIQLYSESYITWMQLKIATELPDGEGVAPQTNEQLELLNGFVENYIENLSAHLGRLPAEPSATEATSEHWSSVWRTMQLFQTLLTPQTGVMNGLVGEELLLWLNMSFVAPSTEEGVALARKEKPWLEENFWPYLIRATVRGLSKGVLHFFNTLANHPSQALRRIANKLPGILESHPRSSDYATEQEFFSRHRRWKDQLRPLRNDVNDLEPSEGSGEWREGVTDLIQVLDGNADVIMRICSEEEGGYGWREVIGVWGVWMQVDFRRQNLPDTLAFINDAVPLDPSYMDETIQAALISQQYKRFAQLAAEFSPWLGAHACDVMDKLGLVMYATPVSGDADEDDTERFSTDDAPLRLRDDLLMNYVEEVLHGDPTLWAMEVDYYAACGPVGRARLGAMLSRMPVDVNDEPDQQKDQANGMDEDLDDLASTKLGQLTGMQRVEKLTELFNAHDLVDERNSLYRVVARLLMERRQYGEAVSYSMFIGDFQTIYRISDLILEEYITKGTDEFITLVDAVPTIDVTLGVEDQGSLSAINRLLFLQEYANFHRYFRENKKRDAARKLIEMLASQIVPKWWWGVILIDAAGMCDDEELWFEELDAYNLLRHVEEIYIRAEQGCGADYLGALEKIMHANQSKTSQQPNTRGEAKREELPIKQLEVVRLSLARYLARMFTVRAR